MSSARPTLSTLLAYGGIVAWVGMVGVSPSRKLAHFCKNTVAWNADQVTKCDGYERQLIWTGLLFALGLAMFWARRALVKSRKPD